jgi:hypothetical protein
MKKRTFFLTSFLFGFVALILNSVGHDQLVQSSFHKAREIAAYAQQKSASGQQNIHFAPSAETIRLEKTGEVLTVVGLIFTFSGVAFLVTAAIRHEPGWYLILTGLFFLDIMVVMLL